MPVLALLLTLALAAASCGTTSQTSTSDTTDSVGVTTSTTVVDAGTSTTTASETTATTSPSTETTISTDVGVDATSDPRCDDPAAVTADIDGDGTPDRVIHLFVDGAAALRLCASAVGYQELPGLGMAEQLVVIDIDEDGTSDVLYGATTAGSAGYQVAVVHNGVLATVTAPGGDAFLIEDGFPEGFPPAGPRYAFGCDDRNEDGTRDLVTMTATANPTGIEVSGTAWTFAGTTVSEMAGFSGGMSDYDDLATALDEAVAKWAPPC